MATDVFSRRAAVFFRAFGAVQLSWNYRAGHLSFHAETDRKSAIPPSWLMRLRFILVHVDGRYGYFFPEWVSHEPWCVIALLNPHGETKLMDFAGTDPFFTPVNWIALVDHALVRLFRNPHSTNSELEEKPPLALAPTLIWPEPPPSAS